MASTEVPALILNTRNQITERSTKQSIKLVREQSLLVAGFGGGGDRHFKLEGHLNRPSGEADLWVGVSSTEETAYAKSLRQSQDQCLEDIARRSAWLPQSRQA